MSPPYLVSVRMTDETAQTAVIGPNAKIAVINGGGSAAVVPMYAVTPFEGIKSRSNAPVTYSQGIMSDEYLPLMNGILRTPCGQSGVVLNFFKDSDQDTLRVPFDELVVGNTMVSFLDYKHPDLSGNRSFVSLEAHFYQDIDGEYLFGLTVCGIGKLFVNNKLVVDNAIHQTPGKSFFGSGTREEVGSTRLAANEIATIRVEFGSPSTQSNSKVGAENIRAGVFRLGCARHIDPAEELADAISLAKAADQVILCAGLNVRALVFSPRFESSFANRDLHGQENLESEGFDRQHMALPGRSDELIRRLIDANPNLAVVVPSGTPVAMPWAQDALVILQAWYGGNEAGNAIADVLFGNENPSGKLQMTLPHRIEDTPAFLNFGSENHSSLYGEGVFVGCRYYEKLQTPVLFPFGHGLSYSKMRINGPSLRESERAWGDLIVTAVVHNQSARPGREVVQLYVRRQTAVPNRLVKELKGCSKVTVPGHGSTSLVNDSNHVCSPPKTCVRLGPGRDGGSDSKTAAKDDKCLISSRTTEGPGRWGSSALADWYSLQGILQADSSESQQILMEAS